ncbi:MAG TPA: GAF domain-containing protein, partial [Phototrophicaceae bacterium]|nr:GAF domain-containing protein [Phototrophicaceae bacterium]
PDTRAEMTVPIVIGDELLGVLDIQDSHNGTFSQTQIQAKTVLANQIAVALQNARSFEQMNTSRQETERIFSSSIDMLGSANFEGYFTRLNPAWSQTLGYTPEELTTVPFIDFVHPDDVEMTNAESAKLATGAKTISFENRYRAKDGSYRWISWNVAPDFDNGLLHFVARDTTRAKEAQDQIKLYADVVQNSPAGVQVYHLENPNDPTSLRLVAANPASQINNARPVEETIGKTLLENAPGLPPEVVNTYANIARNGGTIELGELRYKDENTDEGIYYVKAFGLPNNTMGITFEDITERKRSEELVEKSYLRAEVLREVSTALTEASNEDEILAAIATLTEQYGVGTSSMSSFEIENNEMVAANIIAARSGDGNIIPLTAFPATRLPTANFPMLKLIEAHPETLLIIEDAMVDPRADETLRAFFKRTGAIASISIPLRASERWLGNLTFSWRSPQKFPTDLIEVLETVRPSIATTRATRLAYLAEEQARRESEVRAQEMETVSLVSAQVASTLDINNLVQEVSDAVKANFKLYHAHIYLVDDQNQNLVLAAGSGEAGRVMREKGHSISMAAETSIVARVARTRRAVIVNDVQEYQFFLPNPLLPETRSELAIPMIVADQLVGVLDVQSERINRFGPGDIKVKTALASQIAVAVQNARSFTE